MGNDSLNRRLFYLSLVLTLVVIFQTAQLVSARTRDYSAPTLPEKEGRFYQPINTSENLQWKEGWLVFGTSVAPDNFGGIAIGRDANLCFEKEGEGWNCALSFSGGSHWIKHEIDDHLYYEAGNVGIRTNNPQGVLDVNGDVFFRVNSVNIGNERKGVSLNTYGNTDARGNFFSFETFFVENVGIGVQNPGSRVDVSSGEARVGSSGMFCYEGIAGAIRFFDKKLEGCDGEKWINLLSPDDPPETEPPPGVLELTLRTLRNLGSSSNPGSHEVKVVFDNISQESCFTRRQTASLDPIEILYRECKYNVSIGSSVVLEVEHAANKTHKFDKWSKGPCEGSTSLKCEFDFSNKQRVEVVADFIPI